MRDSMAKKRLRENGCDDKSMAKEMVCFLNKAWTPFHAVEATVQVLVSFGFERLSEREDWTLLPNGRYFFTRNASTVVAFAIGGKYERGGGFRIIGAHTDSPCPKLKPVSKETKAGCLMVNCQNYGGGLWYTWFDRDLTVAGRVIYREGEKLKSTLVRVDRPIMRIPSLAIHLNRGVNDGLKVNFQQHMSPVLASSIKNEMNSTTASAAGKQDKSKDNSPAILQQHPLLLDIVSKEIGIAVEDIVDFELQVCDTQPSAIGGAMDELVFSGRLDNLASCFASLKALTSSLDSLEDDDSVRVIAFFDHEECGSVSAQGAGSTIMMETVKRVTEAVDMGPGYHEKPYALVSCLQKSFVISADMAHALHPNYMGVHESQHGPQFHKGLVIKHNSNQRYATNAVTAALFRECGKRRGLPFQEFVVRSDMGCGSTIGPITAGLTGIRTIDVGMPQWSMHSVREVCGCDDVDYAVKHFIAFWEEVGSLSETLLDSVDLSA